MAFPDQPHLLGFLSLTQQPGVGFKATTFLVFLALGYRLQVETETKGLNSKSANASRWKV